MSHDRVVESVRACCERLKEHLRSISTRTANESSPDAVNASALMVAFALDMNGMVSFGASLGAMQQYSTEYGSRAASAIHNIWQVCCTCFVVIL